MYVGNPTGSFGRPGRLVMQNGPSSTQVAAAQRQLQGRLQDISLSNQQAERDQFNFEQDARNQIIQDSQRLAASTAPGQTSKQTMTDQAQGIVSGTTRLGQLVKDPVTGVMRYVAPLQQRDSMGRLSYLV